MTILQPKPESSALSLAAIEPQGSPRLIEYARRAAHQDNVRKSIRYQALANEMSDVFQEWLMPVQDQFTLSNYIAMLNSRAAKLMGEP